MGGMEGISLVRVIIRPGGGMELDCINLIHDIIRPGGISLCQTSSVEDLVVLMVAERL